MSPVSAGRAKRAPRHPSGRRTEEGCDKQRCQRAMQRVSADFPLLSSSRKHRVEQANQRPREYARGERRPSPRMLGEGMSTHGARRFRQLPAVGSIQRAQRPDDASDACFPGRRLLRERQTGHETLCLPLEGHPAPLVMNTAGRRPVRSIKDARRGISLFGLAQHGDLSAFGQGRQDSLSDQERRRDSFGADA